MNKKNKLYLTDAIINIIAFLILAVLSVALLLFVFINNILLCFGVCLLLDLIYAAVMSKMEKKAEKNHGILFREYFLRSVLPAVALPLAAAAFLFIEWLNSLGGLHYNFDLFAGIFILTSTIALPVLFVAVNKITAR